jgi:molybdopterin-guanine dinucleotide biosynthesis protein A
MVGKKDDSDVVLACWQDQPQPTHAVYSRNCLPVVEDLIRKGDLKIQRLMTTPALRVRVITEDEILRIDPAGQSFLNVNTPSDLDRARFLYDDRLGARYSDPPEPG